MKQFFFIITALIACITIQGQVHIQSGAGLKTTSDVHITFNNINVTNNDASSDFSNAVVIFKGGNNTTLDGNGNWKIKTVLIEKANAQLQLSAALQISNELQMVSGLFDLNGQTLTLLPGAVIANETEAARVTGPSGGVIQTSVSLNAPLWQNPGNLGVKIKSSQNLGGVTIKRWHNTMPGDAKAHRYYEIISPVSPLSGDSVEVQYLDAELNSLSESALTLYSRSNDSSPWVLLGDNGKSNTNNYVRKTGLLSFQQYSFGVANNPLPLRWGKVMANCKGNAVQVQWETLQEEAVKHFEVEKSTSGNQWNTIATVQAKGNSNVLQKYGYTDATITAIGFYRVRSVDHDGKVSYSPVLKPSACNNAFSLTMIPNPAGDNALLEVVITTGSDGRLHYQKELQLSPGLNKIPLSLHTLAPGVCQAALQMPAERKTLNFIRQ
jgi:hypothetical protein